MPATRCSGKPQPVSPNNLALWQFFDKWTWENLQIFIFVDMFVAFCWYVCCFLLICLLQYDFLLFFFHISGVSATPNLPMLRRPRLSRSGQGRSNWSLRTKTPGLDPKGNRLCSGHGFWFVFDLKFLKNRRKIGNCLELALTTKKIAPMSNTEYLWGSYRPAVIILEGSTENYPQ